MSLDETIIAAICTELDLHGDGEQLFEGSIDPSELSSAILKALLENLHRVDIIGDRPGMVHELWADEWMLSLQDDGATLKLFCYGNGDEYRAVRDRALVADFKALAAERAADRLARFQDARDGEVET